MAGKSKNIRKNIETVLETISSHHTGAYAAQAAYFFVLSLIPIIILLLTMVQFTSVTMEDVMTAVLQVFPSSVEGLIRSIVLEVYTRSGSIIPITILVALWSAGKGVLSVTSGLNCIYDNIETRNYLYLRVRASFYTVIFILAIMLSLVLSVFGNSISLMVYEHVPFLSKVVDFIIRIRTVVTLVVLTVFWDLVYKFLPNRKNMAKTTLKRQLPGALFTASGWLLISFFFSVYLDVFTGFSSMYGSLTTIILIMLWLYVCMYIILLGGEVNALLEGFTTKKEKADRDKFLDKQKTYDKMKE
ncbi:YihY/virulence factor BrkB family protein [Mediterraneibacter sp. NSJ-55]|uniref:YihY/virulence factor BrkB family protein n=1 Tax=Mediterraneibacter hominis TaxID=2763054 RepID=A0A923LI38_9FIRM|nr:YihY/virulence factor BrkB family protein [Mediterraneibacter hominis]MBC5688434.1 YihY/virulence factor BrkB family protein [Mediterraneibacter hominis]